MTKRDDDMGGVTMGTQNDPDKEYDRFKAKQVHSEKAKNVLRGAGYARGGGVSPKRSKHKDEKEDKALIKKMVGKAKIKVKHGGKIDGKKSAHRPDKFARGGSAPKGHHTKININVGASQAEKQQALQTGVALGKRMAGAGGMRPMAGAPPQARGPIPGPGPGAAVPGGVPPMAARGGRYARGGKAKGVRNWTKSAGSGGGAGRLAKIETYGTKPKA